MRNCELGGLVWDEKIGIMRVREGRLVDAENVSLEMVEVLHGVVVQQVLEVGE